MIPLLKAGNNSFFSNSFYIFIIRFFPSLANLLVVIWYSHLLPPAVYGNYQHFWIQLNLIYPLACFGIHVLMLTYSRGFVISLLRLIGRGNYAMYALWIVSLSIVFALLQHNALDLNFIVPFLFLLCFSLSTILESFLIVSRKYVSLTIINIAYSTLFWLIHFSVLKQAFSLQALFTYLLVIAAIRLCFYIGIVIVDGKQKREVYTEDIDVAKTRNLWLHLGVYDVSQILFSYIDKFIISLVMAAQVSAVYFNGSQTIPFLPLLLSAAGSAVLMTLADGSGNSKTKHIVVLMNRLGRVLSCFVFPVFFFLFLFRREFIVAVFSDKYTAAIPIFAASLLVLPLRAYSFTTVLQKLHKGNIINTGAFADLAFACSLMYPLYLWLGLPGVALSFVISTYFQSAFYLFYAARTLHVSPFTLIPYKNWLAKLIIFFTLFIGIRYLGHLYFTVNYVLILGGVVMVFAIVSSLWLELKKQEKNVDIG